MSVERLNLSIVDPAAIENLKREKLRLQKQHGLVLSYAQIVIALISQSKVEVTKSAR